MFGCFIITSGKRKKDKGYKSASNSGEFHEKLKALQAKSENLAKPTETDELKLASSETSINPKFSMKEMSRESPIREVAYDGEDEQEDDLSMKRDNSDFDFQSHIVESSKKNYLSMMKMTESSYSLSNISDTPFENKANRDNVSDPGIGKQEFWASPKLFRSCSFVETGEVIKNRAYQLPPSNDKSLEELHILAEKMHSEELHENNQSPRSVMTHRSADKVMLKKHSLSEILPSLSRRLWWKLFLWSHRNMPKPLSAISKSLSFPISLNQQGGYCSDNLEPHGASELSKLESPNYFTESSTTRGNDEDTPRSDGFHGGVSGFWPQNQWVALSVESPVPRVDQWVQEHANQPIILDYVTDDDKNDCTIDYPPSPRTSRSPSKYITHLNRKQNLNKSEDIMHANDVIQSLNLSSTVAHITCVGLKVIPTLSQFSSLRSINLSGNSIAHVTAGSLPTGLHTLNLSRNKITAIEGLRELTRLRVLDLSYNKISRIGHGLSSCTLIKELYLVGNKISEVEGLHRLLKLSVLDLSFNKISTTKAIGQLVANYNTLLALNLLGNPIQKNISDDQLRKAASGLLPKLAYLNKQPVNSQKAREVATESLVKAALGNSSWNSRKRGVKKVSRGRSGSSSGNLSSSSLGKSIKKLSAGVRAQRQLSLKIN